ncbi:hypothetical protein SARC_02966 [Sphaeroforma arctica JP610]|uniref:Uncharacterized protein n=1 Tax=Sphaeroforma arctica JP610 TaxID=667725 RepID=A0A0L0G737_9EUKA|nr:hypothetical protein SARC_02966 [Sphaeroforma arctica JP610]KNC84825.1 hypothetical protein SARC_02966 [Sphaeroforma arctica JP610]|eukprot:XP_014158727.1 hypothetical protein SARC_02966 [Sphaeroforma arctica JP610]
MYESDKVDSATKPATVTAADVKYEYNRVGMKCDKESVFGKRFTAGTCTTQGKTGTDVECKKTAGDMNKYCTYTDDQNLDMRTKRLVEELNSRSLFFVIVSFLVVVILAAISFRII